MRKPARILVCATLAAVSGAVGNVSWAQMGQERSGRLTAPAGEQPLSVHLGQREARFRLGRGGRSRYFDTPPRIPKRRALDPPMAVDSIAGWSQFGGTASWPFAIAGTNSFTDSRLHWTAVRPPFPVRSTSTDENTHHVYLFPAVSTPSLEGFVRVINRSDESGRVMIVATDDGGRGFVAISLSIAINGVKLYQIHRFEVVGFRAVFLAFTIRGWRLSSGSYGPR